ncbi:hypothetical protein HK133_01315 [Streptococcus agalactiae]|nr:hypothetical protein [Streptococcus agalactiae]HEN7249517.1 hypothetical protein [Streptococcus agalactiae]
MLFLMIKPDYIRYFKLINDMRDTMYQQTVFHVQPQAWKYTMKLIDQLVVDDLNHISNEKTTLVK